MKIFIVFAVFIFLIPIAVIQLLDGFTPLHELTLSNDSKIYAGEGEICENSLTKINCMQGLECRTITEKPYITAICLKPGAELSEDLVYKYTIENITKSRRED